MRVYRRRRGEAWQHPVVARKWKKPDCLTPLAMARGQGWGFNDRSLAIHSCYPMPNPNVLRCFQDTRGNAVRRELAASLDLQLTAPSVSADERDAALMSPCA